MRIISQDGFFDYPYESIRLKRDGKEIKAQIVTMSYSQMHPIGSYGTEEEAASVMERVWAAYRSGELVYRIPKKEGV